MVSSKRAPKKSNIFNRLIQGPVWVLTQVRDMYVQSLTGAPGHVSYGNSMGCPTPHIPSVPRSSSVKSSFGTTEADLRELIRAASTRGGGAKAELFRLKSTPISRGGGAKAVPRGKTVGFGTIDEEKPFEYENDDVGLLGRGGYSRNNRSNYAVARRLIKVV